jgi:hypothetical protein
MAFIITESWIPAGHIYAVATYGLCWDSLWTIFEILQVSSGSAFVHNSNRWTNGMSYGAICWR